MDCSPPGSSVHRFSRQEYWSGLLFPMPGALPDPGKNPCLLHWQAYSLLLHHPGNPHTWISNPAFQSSGTEHYVFLDLDWGFSQSSVRKESTCKAGDSGLTPGLGRSAGEGIGYPLQYAQASLVAQLVKNLSAMQDTWVQSLGQDSQVNKSTVFEPGQFHDREAWQTTVYRAAKSWT